MKRSTQAIADVSVKVCSEQYDRPTTLTLIRRQLPGTTRTDTSIDHDRGIHLWSDWLRPQKGTQLPERQLVKHFSRRFHDVCFCDHSQLSNLPQDQVNNTVQLHMSHCLVSQVKSHDSASCRSCRLPVMHSVNAVHRSLVAVRANRCHARFAELSSLDQSKLGTRRSYTHVVSECKTISTIALSTDTKRSQNAHRVSAQAFEGRSGYLFALSLDSMLLGQLVSVGHLDLTVMWTGGVPNASGVQADQQPRTDICPVCPCSKFTRLKLNETTSFTHLVPITVPTFIKLSKEISSQPV